MFHIFTILGQELQELAERENKSMSDEITRLKEEIEGIKNNLEEQKDLFTKTNIRNGFKIK